MSQSQLTVRRRAAIGDVIMVSGIVRRLLECGVDTRLSCKPVCAEVLQRTGITTTSDESITDYNLDDAYEQHPLIKTTPKHVIFGTILNKLLEERGQGRAKLCNLTPVLTITGEEHQAAMAELGRYPRPWIAIGPRSNAWPQRSVGALSWAGAALGAGFGTWLWTGTDPAPRGCTDLNVRTIRRLMAVIKCCDVVISVNTATMHIAAGLGVPLIAIAQASDPWLDLTDQRDYSIIGTDLSCLNCHEKPCPINAGLPPCGLLSPSTIIQAVINKLRSYRQGGISAIIPVYGTPRDRLRQCIGAVLPQVDEVVVAFDAAEAPSGISIYPRTRFVAYPSHARRGYGKTCNYGARFANGRYLLMLNDDVILKPGAVEAMKSVMQPRTAVVGMRLWYPNGTIQHGGTVRRPGDIGWGHTDHLLSRPSIHEPVELENVTHAAALIRREAFYGVLGYDERYDCYNEDNDFNLKVRQAGWKIMYQPNAEGIHAESQSTGTMKQTLSMAAFVEFKAKWGSYFERNRDNNMGTFV